MVPLETVSREDLIVALQGQTIEIPDIELLLKHWPRAVNIHKEKLRNEIDGRMHQLFPPGNRLRKMLLADGGLFGSSWWSGAAFNELCVVTHLSTWLFAWDDETDSVEYADLINDLEKATAFRKETIQYMRACLTGDLEAYKISSNPVISDFGPVGEAVRRKYTNEQIATFFDELVLFVESTQIEQEHQLNEYLPTVEEYMSRRMGSSAVRVCLALTEFSQGIHIPRRVMEDDNMRTIWDSTNVIISLMNDILSIKKEFAQGQVDTILPLLFLRHGSMTRAVEVAVDMISESVEALDHAAEALLTQHSRDERLYADLQSFITVCKTACTGNLSWSLVSGRFKICEKTTHGGIKIQL